RLEWGHAVVKEFPQAPGDRVHTLAGFDCARAGDAADEELTIPHRILQEGGSFEDGWPLHAPILPSPRETELDHAPLRRGNTRRFDQLEHGDRVVRIDGRRCAFA